jgi:hypothetical protein
MLEGLTEAEIMILQVALWEYRSFRCHGDAQRYVDQRYALKDGYTAAFREEKLASVKANLVTAAELRQKLFPKV